MATASYSQMSGLWWKRHPRYAKTIEERNHMMSDLKEQGWLVRESPQRIPGRAGFRYIIWVSKAGWQLSKPCPFSI